MTVAGAYVRPGGLAGALTLMAERPFRPLAGGTDLYPATAARTLAGAILDLTAIDELKGIELTGAGLRIGACESWDTIARAPLPAALACLQAAAREVGGRQIQNAGTIGGNLCNASPAADGVPPLLVLEAEVELASAAGRRRLPLAEFITGVRRTVRQPEELVVALHMPHPPEGAVGGFVKLGTRTSLVISIAMVAAVVRIAQGRIAEARLAVGACSPVAKRLPAWETALVGRRLDEVAGLRPDASHLAGLAPIDDVRATAAYRTEAVRELCRRAVVRAVDSAAGDADGR